MKKTTLLKIDPSSVQVRLGMCAAALAGTAAAVPSAQATIVTFSTPIVIPNDFTGTYINFANGANDPGQPAGWNFNPYNRRNLWPFTGRAQGRRCDGRCHRIGTDRLCGFGVGSVDWSGVTRFHRRDGRHRLRII